MNRSTVRFHLLVAAILPAMLCATVASANPPCGATLDDDVTLDGDLNCPGDQAEPALFFTKKRTLNLAGFTMSLDGVAGWAVGCERGCRVVGPGAIVGGRVGVVSKRSSGKWRNLDVVGVTFQGQLTRALSAKRLKIQDSLIEDSAGHGIHLTRKVLMHNTLVLRSAGVGVLSDVLRMSDSTISGNGQGGVGLSKLRAAGSRIDLNDSDAVYCSSVISACPDISTVRPPKLQSTTCGTSWIAGTESPLGSWGVCALD